MTETSELPYDTARAAVAAGTDPTEAARSVVAAMTDEEKLWCLDGDAPTWAGLNFMQRENGYHRAPFHAARVDRVGLPGISFSDGPRGVVIGNATCFPVAMARGATWDPGLEQRIGDAIGRELRASGANLTGAVCVNLLRHPAWGRAQETYGEDPHHVGEMGAAFTRGLQQHVMATMKHFAVNSMENSRFKVDMVVDDVALHEVFLPHFKRIVDEGVACVMSAYNMVNGTYCGDDPELLTSVLREEWGFDGFVISDWIFGLRDPVASVKAGLDIEMPFRMVRAGNLAPAIERGELSWDDVDMCVTRIVSTLLRFDGVLSQPAAPLAEVGSGQFADLARETAARSTVLLRNEPVGCQPLLPLPAELGSIAVFGSLAAVANLGDGGSSDVYSLDNVTIMEGLQHAAPDAVLTHDDGSDLADVASTAKVADLAVIVVGYTAEHEGEYIGDAGVDLRHLFPSADEPEVVAAYEAQLEHALPMTKPGHVPERKDFSFARGGDRSSVRLLPDDVALIETVAAANPRTVVVLQAGSAVVCSEWIDRVPAVVQTFYGGEQAGHGLADVLFGAVNPSARLPFTVPADEADLPEFVIDTDEFVYDRWHGWWRSERMGIEPMFPFGFGLSYTTFEVRDVKIERVDDHVRATGHVWNVGTVDGADVVHLYADLPDDTAPARLAGFTRVVVPAGESRHFEITAPLVSLQRRVAGERRWVLDTGNYTFKVARHAADAHATSGVVEVSDTART